MMAATFRTRSPRPHAALLLFGLALLGACASGSDTPDATASLPPLDAGAVRQSIPAGIDSAMVTWRGDGVLIPSDDSLRKTPGYVVDSIFPPEEMLRRFQAEAGAPVTALAGGEASADALLRRYWTLLATGDTLGMTPIVASKAEFAYLYFPESAELASGVPPAVSWLLLGSNSGRGLTRALRAASTGDTALLGTTCQPLSTNAGASRITGPCAVIRRQAGQPDTLWLVKHVIVRDGMFKLMSFANDL